MNDICEQSSDRNGQFLILVSASIVRFGVAFFFFFLSSVFLVVCVVSAGSASLALLILYRFFLGLGNTTARESEPVRSGRKPLAVKHAALILLRVPFPLFLGLSYFHDRLPASWNPFYCGSLPCFTYVASHMISFFFFVRHQTPCMYDSSASRWPLAYVVPFRHTNMSSPANGEREEENNQKKSTAHMAQKPRKTKLEFVPRFTYRWGRGKKSRLPRPLLLSPSGIIIERTYTYMRTFMHNIGGLGSSLTRAKAGNLPLCIRALLDWLILLLCFAFSPALVFILSSFSLFFSP